ncbi:MAG: UDP-N-acetylmuramoyl-L-alanine--D-glutamate ligase [Desulfonatronovibrio sp.]
MKELIHSEQLKGHNVAVVGAGRSGLSAAALARALGARVRILEKNEQFDKDKLAGPEFNGVELITGAHGKEHFADAHMVVISPGIPIKGVKDLVPEGTKIFSELELASWFVHEPIIAVTGSNGKTTTTMLIAHALEKMGKKVFAGGNLGTPLSDYVLSRDNCDMLVLEVSSFQLQGCSGFHPSVGIFLNFSINHLDHHRHEQEYFMAKAGLFARQNEKDLAIIALELKQEMEQLDILKSRRVYFVPSGRFSCPRLSGEHNQANMEAAYLACRYFGMDENVFSQALNDFMPPPHRQEIFLKYDRKIFVNDSKATTVQAVSAALKAFDAPIRLLAGGIYKGGDFSELAPLINKKTVKVYLFGAGREVFEKAWKKETDIEYFPDLDEAAARAAAESTPGDTVLLSPGTASFDLFNNYMERGDAFKARIHMVLGLT